MNIDTATQEEINEALMDKFTYFYMLYRICTSQMHIVVQTHEWKSNVECRLCDIEDREPEITLSTLIQAIKKSGKCIIFIPHVFNFEARIIDPDPVIRTIYVGMDQDPTLAASRAFCHLVFFDKPSTSLIGG